MGTHFTYVEVRKQAVILKQSRYNTDHDNAVKNPKLGTAYSPYKSTFLNFVLAV